MKKAALLGTIAAWSTLNKKELLAACQQTMQEMKIIIMMNGMTLLLVSRLHAITNAVGTTQQGSYILHPSIGAVFFDVTHLENLMSILQFIRFGGFQLPIWQLGSKCHLAV